MVNITKNGETITFENGNTMNHMPTSNVIAKTTKDAKRSKI